jgi:hypothetical protein
MTFENTDNAKAKGINGEGEIDGIVFVDYTDESQLDAVMSLVGRDLSEPYSSTSTVKMWLLFRVALFPAGFSSTCPFSSQSLRIDIS